MDNLQDQFEYHNHDGVNSQKILQAGFVTATLPGTMPATAANYGIFFIATRPCYVKNVLCVFTTAGSSTPTLQIEKLTSTQAPDSGTVLLATAFDLAATANTVQVGTFAMNKTVLSMNQGDRLCLKDIGTLTAIAGLNVTVEINFK